MDALLFTTNFKQTDTFFTNSLRYVLTNLKFIMASIKHYVHMCSKRKQCN